MQVVCVNLLYHTFIIIFEIRLFLPVIFSFVSHVSYADLWIAMSVCWSACLSADVSQCLNNLWRDW